jgi:protein O-GlcNAc transferase
VVELVRSLEIDIMVDLAGYTGAARSKILAMRPSPVQVSYLGYPGTMGGNFIDYILADGVVIPPHDDEFYTEKVVRLPHSYLPNDASRRISDTMPTRAEAGLPASGFVFCSFNNSFKITPDIFDVWMGLLRDVAGSVLWLRMSNSTCVANLKREAEKRRVASDRLIFAPMVLRQEDYLARHRLADLFLDTPYYNAHTTACDALWTGVPALTCRGDVFWSCRCELIRVDRIARADHDLMPGRPDLRSDPCPLGQLPPAAIRSVYCLGQ